MQVLTRDRRFEEVRSGTWNPAQQWGSTVPPTNGQAGGVAASGTTVSEKHAMQLAAAWGSVSIICDALATLQIRQYKLVSSSDVPVQMDPSQVIAEPWPEINQLDFITQGTYSLLQRGNLFGNITARDPNTLYPTQVQLVHPDHARVRRAGQGQIEVSYFNKVANPDNVTRAMALSVPEGLVGLNPIEYMRNSFGLGLAQDGMSGSFFANSARPDGVLQVEGDLDPDETKAMLAAWNSSHQGIEAAYGVGVLTSGAKWQPITMNLADAQFLQQMQYSASVISGMIYRVPPHMLGIVDKSTSWGAGIEQQEQGFITNTIGIWLARWEDLMTSWLPPRQFVMFDLSKRLRGDTLQRWSMYQMARVIGAMNNLQIIKAEGLEIPTDPAVLATLADYAAPLNSAPMKPTNSAVDGDKA
jgi:HK97 family phage portal protein